MKHASMQWVTVILLSALFIVTGCSNGPQPVAPLADTGRKIVIFADANQDAAMQTQAVRAIGVSDTIALPLINGAVIMADTRQAELLRQRPDVLRVEDDLPVALAPMPVAPATRAQSLPWGLTNVGARLVWDANRDARIDVGANTGAGIRVGVVDTGIDLTHPDLVGNIKGGINLVTRNTPAADDNGHGTHVAGTIAATNNTLGVLGVAPSASLYAVKVLNNKGTGYVSTIIQGIQWCTQNNMQVINLSLGCTSHVQSLQDAIRAATQRGIVVVAAAGNTGRENAVEYPAKYPEVIAVGATDSANRIAAFSSKGPEVTICAPGSSVMSTYKGGAYATMSGTSMAAPHVSGVAALALAAGVPPTAMKSVLQQTAKDLGTKGRDNSFGYGLVQANVVVTRR